MYKKADKIENRCDKQCELDVSESIKWIIWVQKMPQVHFFYTEGVGGSSPSSPTIPISS